MACNIEEQIQLEKQQHEINLKILSKQRERNELIAELSKYKQLCSLRSGLNERISKVNHERKLMELEYRRKILLEQGLQMREKYKLEIELPAKLAALELRRKTEANCDKAEMETNAKVVAMMELESARIELETGPKLAEARGFQQIGKALESLYLARILDKTAGFILNLIAQKLGLVNGDFRFRLERPLSLYLPRRKLLNRAGRRKQYDNKFLPIQGDTKTN